MLFPSVEICTDLSDDDALIIIIGDLQRELYPLPYTAMILFSLTDLCMGWTPERFQTALNNLVRKGFINVEWKGARA